MNNNHVYASYNGSQKGFTIRDAQLKQLSFVGTNFDFSSITAGSNNDVYLTSGNHIYRYDVNGELLKDMHFPINDINYTGVSVKGDKVFSSYKGSQSGVTVRDINLNQLAYFNTGIEANGIAAGPDDDVYIAAGNHIYHYKTDGTLIKDMAFPSESINYTDVTVICDRVIASYSGSQKGFTVRDLALNQLSWASTEFMINSIAAGPDNNVYLTSANNIYNYSTSGSQLNDMTFPDSRINYTGVSVISTLIA